MALSLNGTSGISGVDGSAGTPALQGSDTNTGISFGTDEVNINTGGTTRATVDSSGRVLVGTSTSRTIAGDQASIQLETAGVSRASITTNAANTAGAFLNIAKSRGTSLNSKTVVVSGDNIGGVNFYGADGTNDIQAASITAAVDGTPGANDMPGRIVLATTADGASSPTERMRIGQDGFVYIRATGYTADAPNSVGFVFNPTAGNFKIRCSGDGTSVLQFYSPTGGTAGPVGSIVAGASSTSYNTSSDYRLKENIAPVTDGITRLQQLKPSRFNFIADPDQTVDGFIAHEVQDVVPEAIAGGKDAVDADGNPIYQGIDQSKLVPLLTAALQEAIAKIESLETRLTALEGGTAQ